MDQMGNSMKTAVGAQGIARMRRCLLVVLAHLSIGQATVLAAGQREADRPNIILVMVDDLGLYDLNCYGYKAVDTPNADKLAEEGMLFRNAYAGAPVCSPSRAAVISGQAPRNNFV